MDHVHSRIQSEVVDRVNWIDTAKGVAIFLVVVHHTVMILEQQGLLVGPWEMVNKAFSTFRMPLFFTVSGLFAASVMRRPWGQLWRTRLSLLVWTYFLWRILRDVFFHWVPVWEPEDESIPMRLVLALVAPTTSMWFLYALCVFFVVGKLMQHRIDYRIQLIVTAIMSMFFLVNGTGNIAWNGMGQYFFFFLAGCYFRVPIIDGVAKARTRDVVCATAVFVALSALVAAFHLHMVAPVAFSIRVMAVVAGCLLAAKVASWALGRVLSALGTRTLPIYVSHMIVAAAMTTPISLIDGLPSWFLGLLPLLVGVSAIVIALGLHWVVARSGFLRYAFEAPSWFAGTPQPKAVAASAPIER